jgi:hypothetical protein
MILFVSGMLVMSYAIAALFFARFWRDTHDRLFAWFACAFALLAAQRAGLVLAALHGSDTTIYYVLRLVAFLLILAAIGDKNRGRAS